MTYEQGYTTSKTIESSLTTSFELSGAVEGLNFKGGLGASIKAVENQSKSTKTTDEMSFKIGAGKNFWVCQRIVNLNIFRAENAVTIWDTDLKVNGKECETV